MALTFDDLSYLAVGGDNLDDPDSGHDVLGASLTPDKSTASGACFLPSL
jgi:hypothetical protein